MLLNQDLPNGHIDCMIDDRNGNTWLGTNSGIITINNKNNSFYLYCFPKLLSGLPAEQRKIIVGKLYGAALL